MLTCFSVLNSIGLAATPPYMVEHSGRANNSIMNAVDSMEFYMAGSTSGLGRRPLKAETCVRITYLSPIWPLGQGKVVYLSDRKRWFAYHQRSPFMVAWTRESRPLLRREAVARMPPAITITHYATAVRKIQYVNASGSFVRCFQPSGIMLVELTWKTSKKHTQSSVRILLFRSRICGCMLFTEKHKLVARKFDVGSSSYFHRAFEHKRRGRYSLEILCWRDSHSRQRSITARSLLAELLCWRVNHSRQRSMAP